MAVKRVPIEEGLDEIMEEINFMKQCQSPYIVAYYGSFLRGDTELWVKQELPSRFDSLLIFRLLWNTAGLDQCLI